MLSLNTTTALLGSGLAVFILFLIRRDHLQLRHGLFWIGIALLAILLGLWPQLIDRFAGLLGIHYSPTLLFLLASIVLLVKVLQGDIENTRTERKIRRLNQRLALYEAAANTDGPTAVPSQLGLENNLEDSPAS